MTTIPAALRAVPDHKNFKFFTVKNSFAFYARRLYQPAMQAVALTDRMAEKNRL
jgi:hypothetical protein